jgi:hypothetical protein
MKQRSLDRLRRAFDGDAYNRRKQRESEEAFMHRGLALAGIIILTAIGHVAAAQRESGPRSPDDATVAAILESLGADRDRPAGEVFRNLQLLEDVSAEQLLRIMQNGFGQALNVRCSHCHVDGDWGADEIRAKRAAREMMLMVRSINRDLEQMRNLDTEMATVNCSTCHRGELRPGGITASRPGRR